MSLNLNEDYEGGCIRFPEYGNMLYKPEPGAALIFSSSLLHGGDAGSQGAAVRTPDIHVHSEGFDSCPQNESIRGLSHRNGLKQILTRHPSITVTTS